MKPSFYNHFFPFEEGKILGLNCITGGLALFEPEKYQLYMNLANGSVRKEEVIRGEELENFYNNLIRGGFLVGDDVDEVSRLQLICNINRYSTYHLGLILIPTLQCNFACDYCFEVPGRHALTPETGEKILKYAKRNINPSGIVNISWYGGEPLLKIDTMESLTMKLLELGKKKNARVSSCIYTNGYLLNRKTALRLKNHEIEGAQVTLDGCEEVHDQRRKLKNGKGTYKRIIGNIEDVCDTMQISLRINVDKRNTKTKDSIVRLFLDLKERSLHKKVGITLAPVRKYGSICKSVEHECCDNERFSEIEIWLYREAIKMGFAMSKLPEPRAAYCSALDMCSVIIDPKGFLYKCWTAVGDPKEKTGHIDDIVNGHILRKSAHPNITKWLRFDPFTNDTCRQCNVLPLCLGGCPDFVVNQGKTITENCETWKYNLEDMLRLIALNRMRQRGKNNVEIQKR